MQTFLCMHVHVLMCRYIYLQDIHRHSLTDRGTHMLTHLRAKHYACMQSVPNIVISDPVPSLFLYTPSPLPHRPIPPLPHPTTTCCQRKQMTVQFCFQFQFQFQLKMTSQRSERPIRALPRLLAVSPRLPSKQCRCLSG